ncbi:hypothetical protein PFISCL1PPCAC_10584 [Pristionchus fissidentatus]|uniref:Ribosomal protein n=1 Tax=Pristionchus fissidentatus TaxID=1538716 RepID=A0AAV5VML7_9BILA|nr:hypothetical protein PFISCL1PPCAC_10584 [Pristionchus fissidentatus]
MGRKRTLKQRKQILETAAIRKTTSLANRRHNYRGRNIWIKYARRDGSFTPYTQIADVTSEETESICRLLDIRPAKGPMEIRKEKIVNKLEQGGRTMTVLWRAA